MLSVLMAAVIAAGALAAPPPVGRYLYVVTCDGRLDKLDTVLRQPLPAVSLIQRAGGGVSVMADAPNGCRTAEAAYDPAHRVFYTAAPMASPNYPDGGRDFKVLGFSVPEVMLTKRLPDGRDRADAPAIRIGTSGAPVIGGALPPRTQTVNLTGFAPTSADLPNQVLETSGERTLLRLFSPNPGAVSLAVADSKTRTIAVLADISADAAPRAHLTPGGAGVLIVSADGADGPANGDLALYDGASGRLSRRFKAPGSQGKYFLTVAPNGVAVFHGGTAYDFVDLQIPADTRPVDRPLAGGDPPTFFADR